MLLDLQQLREDASDKAFLLNNPINTGKIIEDELMDNDKTDRFLFLSTPVLGFNENNLDFIDDNDFIDDELNDLNSSNLTINDIELFLNEFDSNEDDK
jgi:hypothetical protein